MTLETQIAALLAEAAPLRLLPDSDGEAAGLGRIVEQINALRARQAAGELGEPDAPAIQPLPIDEAKKRGRPRKVSALEEGADA